MNNGFPHWFLRNKIFLFFKSKCTFVNQGKKPFNLTLQMIKRIEANNCILVARGVYYNFDKNNFKTNIFLLTFLCLQHVLFMDSAPESTRKRQITKSIVSFNKMVNLAFSKKKNHITNFFYLYISK